MKLTTSYGLTKSFISIGKLITICVSATMASTPGQLDTTFGTSGTVITSVNTGSTLVTGDETARAVVIQADGKIIVAGSTNNGSNRDMALLRYNANGTLDTSFGVTGYVTTAIGPGDDYASAVALQTDGRIVVAGSAFNGSNYDFALVRYLPNGTLDTSFNSTGKVTTAFDTSNDAPSDLAIQPDGKIIAAGNMTSQFAGREFAMARYNTDGTMDTSFGVTGKVITRITDSNDYIRAIALQTDGKIITAGHARVGSNDDVALSRHQMDGSLDTSFDLDGILTIPSANSCRAEGVAIQSDGNIVVAGWEATGANLSLFLLHRILYANGALDFSFDGDGRVAIQLLTGENQAKSVAVQHDGKIIAGGYAVNNSYVDFRQFAVARFNPNGSLDPSFDGDGKATTAIGSEAATGETITLQNDGKVVVAGGTQVGSLKDFAIARYWAFPPQESWRLMYFGNTANSGNAVDGEDPDDDGLPNLLEYALNLPPNAASRVSAAAHVAGSNLEYTYTRSTAAYNGGTTFQVEWSDDLTTWFTTGVVESLISDDGTLQQVKATLPAGSGGRRFVRLRVQ